MALFPIVIVLVLAAMWWMRRHSTLTRQCRWRAERTHPAPPGQAHFRCAACGAETDCPNGKTPNQCLRP
ncbi:hypothetical protein U879_20055 [Defluviimonas sp. 20V17]|uniref:Uncharacterized protein n=1 Tax=Allgaiera indica TaxID=765699 RepID=A0AAN4USK8_9RHOB|nr:hypothetical protein [Allgaiera indica]KDB01932.1 hypothetical protein U879_20055 [Defluviimonas sp. 20V17]GHE03435.1 hypothetical protein GCM10008024_26860 [Allgaiera indica]SDX25804.1 hypothetical protein SAMN05444006_112126 [Allgaiera indica]